jgi:hypothetical protein
MHSACMHMHICTALLVYALVHALSFALVITLIASPAPPRLARLSRRIASLHWLKHSCASQHAHMHCLVGNALRAPCLCCTRAHSCASHAQCVHAHAHMHRLVGSALCAPCLCCTRGCSFMCITCTVRACACTCALPLAGLFVHRAFAAHVLIHVHHMHSACMHMHVCTASLAGLFVHRAFAAHVLIHVHHMHSACMHVHIYTAESAHDAIIAAACAM